MLASLNPLTLPLLHLTPLTPPQPHQNAPQIVLFEEAGEVFEAHVLVSLSAYTEQLILIGDHEQLRPKPEEWDLQKESGR